MEGYEYEARREGLSGVARKPFAEEWVTWSDVEETEENGVVKWERAVLLK